MLPASESLIAVFKKGALSIKWQTLAAMDMYNTTVQDERQGESMIRATLLRVADRFSKLWEAPSKALHDTKDEELRDGVPIDRHSS